MKKDAINYLIVLCTILIGCSQKEYTENNSGLLIFDANRTDYPTYTINLHEIADVEYIPLETTENSLLVRTAAFCTSDKYIITDDVQGGDVWIFDRSGKFLSSFNKQGNGPGEYNHIIKLTADFKKEEIFIYQIPSKIIVYSFNGDHKRTFVIPDTIRLGFSLNNYDDEFLIGHNTQYLDYGGKPNDKVDNHPYYLIRKDNGRMIPIRLYINNRISSVVAKEGLTKREAMRQRKITSYDIEPLINNGSEIIISDIALDTIYSFKNMMLSPIACRIPPVQDRTPHKAVTADLDTDYFMRFRITDLIYDPDARFKDYDDGTFVIWNKRNERFEKWDVYDPNYSANEIVFPGHRRWSSFPANHGEEYHRAHTLIEKYEKGELKGELKEIASTMKEDDNLVLVICRYK